MASYQFPNSGAISLSMFRPYCFTTSQSVQMKRITKRYNEQNENQNAYIGNPQRNGDNLPWHHNSQRGTFTNNDDIVYTTQADPTPTVSLSTYYDAKAEFWTSQPNKYLWNYTTLSYPNGVAIDKSFYPYYRIVIYWDNATIDVSTTQTSQPTTISSGGLTYERQAHVGFGFDPWRQNSSVVARY